MSVLIIVKRFVSIRIECMNYSGLSSFILTNVLASIMFVAIKLFGINTENSLNNLLVNIPLGVLVIGISMTIIFFLFRNSFNLPDIH